MKKLMKNRHFRYSLGTFTCALIIYLSLGFLAAKNMFYMPDYDKVDIQPLLMKAEYSEADYDLLFQQTGLAQPVVDELKDDPDFIPHMLSFQDNYLRSIDVQKTSMNAITRLDKAFDTDGVVERAFELAPYHNGYLFFTKSTYTANWRHGHAAIVIDEKRGKVLESLEPGTISVERNASSWEFYPTFKMMRLKDTPQEELDLIAEYARTQLMDVPYNILAMKNQGDDLTSTHCSFIVWQAFKHFDIDLDSNGGIFVSPEDIAKSPYLETLQIFGFHPERDW